VIRGGGFLRFCSMGGEFSALVADILGELGEYGEFPFDVTRGSDPTVTRGSDPTVTQFTGVTVVDDMHAELVEYEEFLFGTES